MLVPIFRFFFSFLPLWIILFNFVPDYVQFGFPHWRRPLVLPAERAPLLWIAYGEKSYRISFKILQNLSVICLSP